MCIRDRDVPVVAIGGIHKDNIIKLKGSGADGVALVSAIFSAPQDKRTEDYISGRFG